MLVAFGYWGFHAGQVALVKWVLAIGLPLAVAVFWGLFLAPKAAHRLGSTAGVAVSLGLFWLAGLMLIAANQPALGAAMIVIAGLNRALVLAWKQW